MRLSIRKEVEIHRQVTRMVEFVMAEAIKKLQEEENLKAMMEEMERYLEESGKESKIEKTHKSDQDGEDTEKERHQDGKRTESESEDEGESGSVSPGHQDTISAMLDDLERRCGQVEETTSDRTGQENMGNGLQGQDGESHSTDIAAMLDDLERQCGQMSSGEPVGIGKESVGDVLTGGQEGSVDKGNSFLDTEDASVQIRSPTDQGIPFLSQEDSTGKRSVSGDESESMDLGCSVDQHPKTEYKEKITHGEPCLFGDSKIQQGSHETGENKSGMKENDLLNAVEIKGHLFDEIDNCKIEEKKTGERSRNRKWRLSSIFHRRGTKETSNTDSNVESEKKTLHELDSSKVHPKDEDMKVQKRMRRRLTYIFCCGKSEE